MTSENLERELKIGNLNPIYVLYGEEIYLLESAVKKIKKLFGEIQKGINYIELDDENYINALMPEIQTPPFGYDKKMIIVKNSGLFKKETKKKTAGLKELRETLEKYLKTNIEEIKQNLVIVFIEENVEKLNITKQVEAVEGVICKFEYLKPFQIEKRLEAITKAYGVDLENGALKELIETSGISMQELINELRKQIEYASEGGCITKENVQALAIKTLDSNIFDLTDNLGKRNIQQSLKILDELLYQKEAIQKILITMYNHFKKLYIIKLAEKYGEDVGTTLNLKPNQAFLLGRYKMQAKYFTELELRGILDDMIKLDENSKIRFNRYKYWSRSNIM